MGMTQMPDSHLQPPLHVKLDSIQVMRAIGMGMVLIGHVAQILLSYGTAPKFMGTAFNLYLLTGEWILDLFFVVSGFIMVYISAGVFGKKGAGASFLFARISRIVPVYWFYTTVMVVLILSGVLNQQIGGRPFGAMEMIKSYLFIPYNAVPPEMFNPRMQPWPILNVGWTLNFEMLFYVMFAGFLAFPIKRALTLFGVTIAVLMVVHLFVSPFLAVPYFWTSPQLIKFFAGCLVGYVFLRGVYFNVPAWLCVVVMLTAITLNGWWYKSFSYTHMHEAWFHVLPALLCSVITVCAVLTPLRDKVAPKFLSFMGDASYSIYLSHIIVLLVLVMVPMQMMGSRDFYLALGLSVVAVPVALLVGVLSYKYLELPVTHFLRKK